jgi:hypothetical protein
VLTKFDFTDILGWYGRGHIRTLLDRYCRGYYSTAEDYFAGVYCKSSEKYYSPKDEKSFEAEEICSGGILQDRPG